MWTRVPHLAPAEWIYLPITAPCVIWDHKGDILLTRWKSPLWGMSLHGGHVLTFVMSYGLGGVQFPTFMGKYYKRHGLQPCWRSYRQCSIVADSWTFLKCELLCDSTPRKACRTPENTTWSCCFISLYSIHDFYYQNSGHLADKIAYLCQESN